MALSQKIGRHLARYLSRHREAEAQVSTSPPGGLAATILPGDVLLVDGNSGFSVAIKYLTQSSWSHAALYVGNALGTATAGEELPTLIEADINVGIRAVPLSEYESSHTRICRPIGLTTRQIDTVCRYAIAHLGQKYDMKNIFDLARYLLPTPLVPTRWRRRLLELGSGEATQFICSSLIARAFQLIHYPILPEVLFKKGQDAACMSCYQEVLRIRHHSLFTPRDFDVSPYFQIIKPTLVDEFDPLSLNWENGLD